MSESARQNALQARLTTGAPGLDVILNGGVISGAVYIVQGSPGAGKTILANQMCFHQAAQGAKCLYLTVLAESHDRMLEHLHGLAYFDKEQVPDGIYYESAYGTLEHEGLDGILRLLTQERKARNSTLIVLDGLFVLEETISSAALFRKFINNLSSFAHLTGTTILLLTNSGRSSRSPEYTMVDGWLELGTAQPGYETYRYLQVHKFRGSGFISGQHLTSISNDGIKIYPRLESSLGQLPTPVVPRALLSTGIPDLDQMLGGGVRQGSSTLLVGPTGIGKTTLGLEFIRKSTVEEPGLIFGLYEAEDDLIDQSRSLGIDLEPLIRDGVVEMLWRPATENRLDELGYQLINAVRRRGVKRLFVDGINAFQQSAFYPQRVGRFFAALTNELRAEGVTVMYTLETEELVGGELKAKLGTISAVAQNIVVLRYVELEDETHRTLAIVKVRTSRFSAAIREFFITDSGVVIGERFHGVDDVLTGHAHLRQSESGN